jgi:hypothetical protein
MRIETKISLASLGEQGFFAAQIAELELNATQLLLSESQNPKDSNRFREAFADFCSRRMELNRLAIMADQILTEINGKKEN